MEELIKKLSFEVIAEFQYDLQKCKTTANLQKRIKVLIEDLVKHAFPGYHAEIVADEKQSKELDTTKQLQITSIGDNGGLIIEKKD